jgi:hypothetical protein
MNTTGDQSERTLRPRDLALLLLASGDLRPRIRARDQEADRAGLTLKRRVLDRLAALDPEPDEFVTALAQIIEEIGPPTGPTRAVAQSFQEDWHAALAAPEWVAHLLAEATLTSEEDAPRARRTAE